MNNTQMKQIEEHINQYGNILNHYLTYPKCYDENYDFIKFKERIKYNDSSRLTYDAINEYFIIRIMDQDKIIKYSVYDKETKNYSYLNKEDVREIMLEKILK